MANQEAASGKQDYRVAFWVPLDPARGLGHLYRSAGLIEALGQDAFLVNTDGRKAPIRGIAHPCPVVDFASPDQLLEELARQGIASLYVDHYFLDASTIAKLGQRHPFQVCYFDGSFAHPRMDALINTNAFASLERYASGTAGDSATRYFLGTDYMIPRQAVVRAASSASGLQKAAGRVLISLGASDTTAIVRKLLPSLPPESDYRIILGPATPESATDTLQGELAARGLRGQVIRDPQDILGIMASCERAIVSSSSTVYELAVLGIPFVALETLPDQKHLAAHLRARGLNVYESADSGRPSERFAPAAFRRFEAQLGSRAGELIDYLTRR